MCSLKVNRKKKKKKKSLRVDLTRLSAISSQSLEQSEIAFVCAFSAVIGKKKCAEFSQCVKSLLISSSGILVLERHLNEQHSNSDVN